VVATVLDGRCVIALERGDLREKLGLVVAGERLCAFAAFSRREARVVELADHRKQQGAMQERPRMRGSGE
jgi:hypothetical protein